MILRYSTRGKLQNTVEHFLYSRRRAEITLHGLTYNTDDWNKKGERIETVHRALYLNGPLELICILGLVRILLLCLNKIYFRQIFNRWNNVYTPLLLSADFLFEDARLSASTLSSFHSRKVKNLRANSPNMNGSVLSFTATCWFASECPLLVSRGFNLACSLVTLL